MGHTKIEEQRALCTAPESPLWIHCFVQKFGEAILQWTESGPTGPCLFAAERSCVHLCYKLGFFFAQPGTSAGQLPAGTFKNIHRHEHTHTHTHTLLLVHGLRRTVETKRMAHRTALAA